MQHRARALPSFTAIALLAALASGCAHESFGLKMESRSVAREFGFPHCRVSGAMSQEALLAHASFVGNPNLASFPEWIELADLAGPNDQLRLVDCLSVTSGPTTGQFFYALFRDNRPIARVTPMIFD